jgi:murein L,D-transpeptidase YafK
MDGMGEMRAGALLLAIAAAAAAPHAAAQGETPAGAAEARLQVVLESLGRGGLDAALAEADRLIQRYPNFQLAHLLRGDLLLARVRPITRFGNASHGGERLEELKLEALARVRAQSERPPQDAVPRFLLQMSPAQKHAIVIDASRFRLYLYENANGTPRLVSDFYGTLGRNGIDKLREGDRKTPIGVYFVTSMIPGNKLPDLYGWGALPISYPNEWDRLAGRTGYGIWLHGVPADTYARAPWASDGCIALANPDIEALAARVAPGATPVVIAERAEWLAPREWREQSEAFLRQLEAWRADWESRDTERYLANYARGFRSDGMDLAAWSAHKRRVNAAKAWIKVRLADLSVLRSPGQQDLMVVTFRQDYRSNSYVQRSHKRQYWIMEDGRWKIAYEAPVGRAPVALPESYPGRSADSRSGARSGRRVN